MTPSGAARFVRRRAAQTLRRLASSVGRGRRLTCTACGAALLVTLLLAANAVTRAAEPTGTPASREALALCHQAQKASGKERDALLEQSLERADAAIAEKDDDALAHFARFCALGEQARAAGVSLSNLVKLWAIRDAIDRTLELAPDFPDALLGKGAFLMSVPRLLGGSPKEGERLVRRALEIEPDYVGARLVLAEALLEDDRKSEAREEASRALASAEAKNDPEGVADARRLLATIDAES